MGDRAHQDGREEALPKQVDAQMYLGGIHHHAGLERNSIERGTVAAGDLGEILRGQLALRHGFEFERIDELLQRCDATGRLAYELLSFEQRGASH